MFDNLLNPDYKKFYGIYKKLPGILAIIIAALFFIWSIVDLSVFSDDGGFYGGYFHSPSYGIMELESPILVLLIWWISGAITTACTWFFSVLVVSATVARTDAAIELNQKINSKNDTPNNVHPTAPQTPTIVVPQSQPTTPRSPTTITPQTPATITPQSQPSQQPIVQPTKPVVPVVEEPKRVAYRTCPYCGAVVKSNVCEMCGKTNNLFK